VKSRDGTMSHPHPNSLWAAITPPRAPAPALQEPVETEIAVIGGGFSGLSTALHLAKSGRKVVVLEGASVGWGASGRNNGQVIPTLTAAEPDAIEARHGEAGARFVALIRDSAEALFALVRDEAIACEAEQTGWFQPAHRPSRMKLSEKRVEAWARRGAPCRLVGRDEAIALLGSKDWHGGMYNPTGGHINPLALARGLAAACEARGVRIFENTRVTGTERVGPRWQVRTESAIVRADTVVLATNAYTDALAPALAPKVAASLVPVLSWQMATEPLSAEQRATIIPGRQAISDTHGDLRFFRYDARNRLVTGGALIVPANGAERLRRLVGARLAGAFPALETPRFSHVWNGYIGITEDRFPHIHRLGPDFWGWAGCNGRGVALALSLGRELAGAINGAPLDTLALPVSDVKPIAFQGLARRIAPCVLALYRWRDGRD